MVVEAEATVKHSPTYIPPRRDRYFATSGALTTQSALAQRDPRDGAAPPPLPVQSPANPLAVAQLISGNAALTPAGVADVLGAPLEQLLLDKTSILYGDNALKTAAKRVKASGAPIDIALVDPSMIYADLPKGTDAKGAPLWKPVEAAPVTKADLIAIFVAWATEQLAAGGVGCPQWMSMSDEARLNTVRNFFYGPQTAEAAAARPQIPNDSATAVDLINDACGIPRVARPAPVVTTQATPSAQDPRLITDAWWATMRGLGMTCDRWIATVEHERLWSVESLLAQRLLDARGYSAWQIMQGVDGACARSQEPASSNPSQGILGRLRTIADCAHLDAQDKIQQIQVIQAAFPELNRDRRALYRLAQARYDLCHPAPESGWTGEGLRIADQAANIRVFMDAGQGDILDGDVRGMSRVQWVKQGQYMPANGGPDLMDPVQGAVGDCYFISAMASVAWSRPDALLRTGQPVGNDRRRFTFGGASVDVSERTPCIIPRGFAPIFARGNRFDAQWPGVVEKAYAAWQTRDTTDRPDVTRVDNMPNAAAGADGLIRQIGGAVGRSLDALPALTGGRLFWFLSFFRSDDDFLTLLAARCDPSGRARVPMCAGTYPSGGFVDQTGLAPSHAYSVLGHGAHSDGRRFVVLRNPWGSSWAGLPHAAYRVPIEGRWLGRMALDGGDGGVFALAHGAFSAAFEVLYGVDA